MIKRLRGFKTFLLNTISATFTAIVWVLPDFINLLMGTDLSPLFPLEYAVYITLGLNAAHMLLRKFSNKTDMFDNEYSGEDI